MKFREIFRFEFVYQARRVRTWLYWAVLFIVAFQLMRTAGDGDVFVNSPFSIAQETVLTVMLWILMAPAVAGSAAARDAQTRMAPLVYTTPISKTDYLAGRFLAAFALNAMLLLAVPVGILAALILPGMDAENVGPLRPAVYLSCYGVLALTTAFTVTSIQFSLATLSRRTIVSYIGSVLFLVMASIAAGTTINLLKMPRLGNLLDPIGFVTILGRMSDSWTPLQMNTVLIGLEGSVVANRLLWVGIAVAILAFTHARFRLSHRAG